MPLAVQITPNQSAALKALREFLTDVLPVGVQVVTAQSNMVPEPPGTFVMMTPIRFERLETNVSESRDVVFEGQIADLVLTVTTVAHGEIVPGASISGPGVVQPTHVGQQSSGPPGGAGTYAVDTNQAVGPVSMAAGLTSITLNSMQTVQLDFHSDGLDASDMAQTFSTLFRDGTATEFFSAIEIPVAPLYCDDPAQRPFVNDQKQYEWRWVVEAKLQINQTIKVPQQYADAVAIDLVSVDVAYPP